MYLVADIIFLSYNYPIASALCRIPSNFLISSPPKAPLNAAKETSNCLEVGSDVVMFCNHNPGFDNTLNIKWPLKKKKISDKDKNLPLFNKNFKYF